MLCFLRISVSSYLSFILLVPWNCLILILTCISIKTDLSCWTRDWVCWFMQSTFCPFSCLATRVLFLSLFCLEPMGYLIIHLYFIFNSLRWVFMPRNLTMPALPYLISAFWKEPMRILTRIHWLSFLLKWNPWTVFTLWSSWCKGRLCAVWYFLSSLG